MPDLEDNDAGSRELVSRAKKLVDDLAAAPRFAGSESETRCRHFCAGSLKASGFETVEESFEFSEFPAKWGPSIISLFLASSSLAAGWLAANREAAFASFMLLISAMAATSFFARWIARHGTRKIGLLRSQSVNLVATRSGAADPAIWLVAHIDSKSQTIPMLVRVASVGLFAMLSSVLTAVVVTLALVSQSSVVEHATLENLQSTASVLSVLSAASILPVMFCFVGNRSCGALDNATGVAAVLLAAEMLPRGTAAGILITSGEELALAGAREFASNRNGRVALNCDTIDDRGRFICMASARPSTLIDDATDAAAMRTGVDIERLPGMLSLRSRRISGMIPGIFADNVAFTDAGWESFTLSRGNLSTLGRVHTPGDRPENLEGTGIVQAARFLAAAVEELT